MKCARNGGAQSFSTIIFAFTNEDAYIKKIKLKRFWNPELLKGGEKS